MDPKDVRKLIEDAGGTVEEMQGLPDGSGFATASFPLPKDHWIYGSSERPPMPFRMGTDDPRRMDFAEKLREAGRYAIKAATMNGKDTDFDPDALILNLIVGAIGYWTPDGLSGEDWSNPKPVPPVMP